MLSLNTISQEFRSKIIDYQGTLHKALVLRLQDPTLAFRIFQSFQNHIAPLLQKEEEEHFHKALVISAILPGSKKAFTKTLESLGIKAKEWKQNNTGAFKNFLSDCLPSDFPTPKGEIFKVCILTTSASGGNHSVSKAVAHLLNNQENIQAEIIDVEEFAVHDPLKQAIGITYDGIYEHYFQKKGGTFDVLLERDKLTEELANHVEPRTLEALKEKICQIAPNLLITTRNYKEDDLSLASSLNIPLRVLYCDYDICMFHHHLIGKTDPNLIKFWFPALKPECFKSLLPETLYNPHDTWEATAGKIATHTKSSFEEIMASFEEVGFPVNEEFTRSTNINELRMKWGFDDDEEIILISMGKNGVAEIENVFFKLKESPKHAFKVRYVFICGTNEALKERLEKQTNLSDTALKKVSIYGHITLKEMAELMNLSKFTLGKPGGASTSEHLALGKLMFVMFSHEFWEGGNERQMQQEGLIERYNEEKALHLQIEECLQREEPKKPLLIDWKSKIINNLK